MLSNNKSIQVSNNCKIYIMSPANTATGGPEALHQLAYVLQNSLKLPSLFCILIIPGLKKIIIDI